MTEHNDTIAFLPDRSYVIPGRLVKQLVESAQPAPKPKALHLFIDALEIMGVPYSWEIHSCGDPDTAQVWFKVGDGWELVVEFDNETGDYKWMGLDS